MVNIKTGEQHFFRPFPVADFKSYTNPLTGKELLLLQNLANGLDIEKICKKMGIKMATLKSHRAEIYKKLGVDTKLSAINKAFIYGIIK